MFILVEQASGHESSVYGECASLSPISFCGAGSGGGIMPLLDESMQYAREMSSYV